MNPTRHDLDDHDDLRELSQRLHDLADQWEVVPGERPDLAPTHRRRPDWLPNWLAGGAMVPVLAGLALVVLAIAASVWLADLGDTPDPVEAPASHGLFDLLEEVPADVVGVAPIRVELSDLATATRLAGVERPTADADAPTRLGWLEGLSGVGVEDGGVLAPVPTSTNGGWYDTEAFEDELGWLALDVDTLVEVTANAVLGDGETEPLGSMDRHGVVTGPAGSGAFPDTLRALADGVVQAGTDDSSLADATLVRPQGGPLFLARVDGHLAYGTTESMVRSWQADGPTLADDPDVAAIVEELAVPDLTAARIVRADVVLDPVTDFPDLDPADLLPAAVDTVGLAWSRDDAGLLVTVAYLHDSPEDASRNADALASVWSTTASLDGSVPDDHWRSRRSRPSQPSGGSPRSNSVPRMPLPRTKSIRTSSFVVRSSCTPEPVRAGRRAERGGDQVGGTRSSTTSPSGDRSRTSPTSTTTPRWFASRWASPISAARSGATASAASTIATAPATSAASNSRSTAAIRPCGGATRSSGARRNTGASCPVASLAARRSSSAGVRPVTTTTLPGSSTARRSTSAPMASMTTDRPGPPGGELSLTTGHSVRWAR